MNSEGVIKVWMNEELERSYLPKKLENESLMVRSLLEIIEKNTDKDTMPRQEPSIFNFVYKNKGEDDIDFNSAQMKFEEYVKKYNNGQIPQRLTCFDKVGGTGEVAKQI